ncbi:bacteriohemerythrin [Candidatus Hydrogenedentota bacterium]
MKMEWDDNLSVGVELIDEQHKRWIEHLNNVSASIESHHGPIRISETLGFLADYTRIHFSTEEKNMTANNYPGFGHHKNKHEELKTTLNNLMQDYEEEGATHTLAEAIDTFLGNWLTKHIREVDMKFGEFIRDKGIVVSDEIEGD